MIMQRAGFVLWILVCGILVFDIGNACVRAQDAASRIKTQEVDVVNASGATVIQIARTSTGPLISVCGPDGIERDGLDAEPDGSAIAFTDANDKENALLASIKDKDGMEDTLIVDPQGKVSLALVVRTDHNGLSVYDKARKERATIGYYSGDDEPIFAGEAANNQAGIFASVFDRKAHALINDPKGTPRVDLGIDSNNDSYFALAGKDGNASWDKTFDAGGSPIAFGGDTSGSSGSGSGIGNAIRRNGSR